MKGRENFKSRIISAQKPQKRRARTDRISDGRRRIDLIELHRNIINAERQGRPTKFVWIGGVFSVLICALVFFLLGYFIAGLPIPLWAKILLLTVTGTLGFVLGRLVAALFH